MSKSYQRQSEILGAMHFFFSREKLIEMSVSHGMARNLESTNQKEMVKKRGNELLAQWEARYRSDYSAMFNEIRFALWSSLRTILSLITTSLLVAYLAGSINLEYTFNSLTVIAYLGASLVGWAALMELGNDFMVWDGPAYPRLVHKVIFKVIFVPGVLLVLLGILL